MENINNTCIKAYPLPKIHSLFVYQSTWHFITIDRDRVTAGAFILYDEDMNGIEEIPTTESIYYGLHCDQEKVNTIYVDSLNRMYFINLFPDQSNPAIWYNDVNCKEISKRRICLDLSWDESDYTMLKVVTCLVLARFIVIFLVHSGVIYCFDVAIEHLEKNKKVLSGIESVIDAVYDKTNKRILLFSPSIYKVRTVDLVDVIPLNILKSFIVHGYVMRFQNELSMAIPSVLYDLLVMFCEF